MNNQLRGIPDSMDIVSLWGGAFNLTEAQKSDLKEVREKKGLRVLYCQHITVHKAGFVNIVGNPNVGKSTLMNVLVGERISIATFKAQTTRHRIKFGI